MQDDLIQTRAPQPAVSRRVFFKRIGAVVLGGALFLGGRFAPAAGAVSRVDSAHTGSLRTAPNNAPDIRSPLERSVFAAHLGETFFARSGAPSVIPLELIAVHAVGHAAAHPSLDTHTFENCFSVLFRGTQSLPQATYPFSHPQMGNFPLFIVPMAQDDASFAYQAVFHRLPA